MHINSLSSLATYSLLVSSLKLQHQNNAGPLYFFVYKAHTHPEAVMGLPMLTDPPSTKRWSPLYSVSAVQDVPINVHYLVGLPILNLACTVI